MTTTVGQYIARRLEELKLKDVFVIPGDYNLILLDEFIKNKKLNLINCCNELNGGYACDGYTRATGLSALALTYSVGGLSAINAVAGAYSEFLPMIVISGSPNTNSYNEGELLHHTLGGLDYHYVREMYDKVTVYSVTLSLTNAPYEIDFAINKALQERRPVYIEVPCNIANAEISSPTPFHYEDRKTSNKKSLKLAIKDAAALLNKSTKPVVVAGSHIRPWGCGSLVEELVTKSNYALAVMPDAKGFVSEALDNFIGIYWGSVSTPGCAAIVDSSDLALVVGPQFTDYTTNGSSIKLLTNKTIIVCPNYVKIDGTVYTDIVMKEFLAALTEELTKNDTSLTAYKRIEGQAPTPPTKSDDALTTRYLFSRIQAMLSDNTAVLAETGDSWFNTRYLKLPQGCLSEIQMQYGSIGWSVGATLGYQLGLGKSKRVIACIGDGAFQMGAQEVSTMVRYEVNPIIFLMNNGYYSIEVQIHDGPYNLIENWDYNKLIEVYNANKNGKGWNTRVETCGELDEAIKTALGKDELCFIEVKLDRDDCNKHLLEWGTLVAQQNSRK